MSGDSGRRRTRAVAALLAIAGVAALASGLVLASSPRASSAAIFPAPMSADALAAIRNPHLGDTGPTCQTCHPDSDAPLGAEPVALCARCHDPNGGFNHPLAVPQVKPAAGETGLPHGTDDRVLCHTCHDPHDFSGKADRQRWGLRFEFNELCAKCHPGY